MRVDHGSHRLHPSIDPAILADLPALLGTDLQRRAPNGRIPLGGRWIAFPLRPLDLLLRLPPSIARGTLRDAAPAPVRRPEGRASACSSTTTRITRSRWPGRRPTRWPGAGL